VLIAALTLAVLYFGLMELLLVDSSRELAEARRFRARVVAGIVAENAVELAALQMVSATGTKIQEVDDQGAMSAEYERNGVAYEITAEGVTSGVLQQTATVFVQGRIDPNGGVVKIDYTMHGQ
jgi:hypothetical protein